MVREAHSAADPVAPVNGTEAVGVLGDGLGSSAFGGEPSASTSERRNDTSPSSEASHGSTRGFRHKGASFTKYPPPSPDQPASQRKRLFQG